MDAYRAIQAFAEGLMPALAELAGRDGAGGCARGPRLACTAPRDHVAVLMDHANLGAQH